VSFFNNVKKRKNKYGAIRTSGFSSKLEAAVHQVLLLRQATGEIKDIKCQQSVLLMGVVRWRIDFSAIDCKSEKLFYIEAKGLSDRVFKMKLKLFKHDPPARLEIWRGSYMRPFLSEVVESKK